MGLALLVGTGLLLVSLLCYGTATGFIVQLLARMLQRGYAGPRLWKNITVLFIVSLVTALVHLVQIALWALAIRIGDVALTFEDAFYCSAQNYTALGYGDVLLPGRWRLLGPLEAINGLLLFGLSTAVMFAILSHLIASRLHLQPGHPHEAAVSPQHEPRGRADLESNRGRT
jgi:hypothetical protein